MKKQRLFLAILFLGLMLCFYPQPAKAESNTFYPLDDAYVDSANPDTNYGISSILHVEFSGIDNCNIYLYFDLSSLSGNTITNATLIMAVSSSSGMILLTINPVTTSWLEIMITWNIQPTMWLSPSITTASYGAFSVITIVTAWADNSISNYGFVITMASPASSVTYHSKESLSSPELYVEYVVPSKIPLMEILGIIGILAAVIFLYHMRQRNRELEPIGSLFS